MTTIDLAGDVVLVTGAAGSIGRATAVELARAGAAVIAGDVSLEGCEETVRQVRAIGGNAVGSALDVRSSESIGVALAKGAVLGPLSGLVNAAGVLRVGRVDEMAQAEWDTIQDVNVRGTFLATQAAVPLLRQTRGRIVNIASVSAFIGSDGGSAYAATKGAVLSFTYATAGELAPAGVRVNAVCPGWVDGGFTHQAMADSEDPDALVEQARRMHYLERMATPTDVANAVTWLMSPLASFVTGTALFIDGGYMIRH